MVLHAKIFFYFLYVFKGAKLAKFNRFEAGWKLMWDEVRDASYEVRVFLSQSSLRWGEMIAFLSTLRNIRDVLDEG